MTKLCVFKPFEKFTIEVNFTPNLNNLNNSKLFFKEKSRKFNKIFNQIKNHEKNEKF